MCYLGRGENEREITTFCLLLKENLKEAPKSIAIDYKPAWDRGIKHVFPRTLIIRDGFHTVQLINRAIFKDFKVFSKKIFTTPIMETRSLYQAIRSDKWQGNTIKFIPTHDIVKEFKYFHSLLVSLYNIKDLQNFSRELNDITCILRNSNTKYSLSLREELLGRLPTNGLTVRNVKYYKTKIKGALSRVLRAFRRRIELEKKAFTSMRYLLLKRAEKLTSWESDFLEQFLKKFPNFKKYRALSLRISDIYHLPPTSLTDSIITGITLWDGVGEALQAAVKTLKKNVREIFNFLRVLPKNTPNALYKKVRTSPEPVMRKIKDVVRTRFGLRTSQQAQLYLEQQLKCQVIIAPAQKTLIAA